MTIQEIMDKKITKIRLPQWNQYAYLELNLLPDGFYGPWTKLYDMPSMRALGAEDYKDIGIWLLEGNEWEEAKL